MIPQRARPPLPGLAVGGKRSTSRVRRRLPVRCYRKKSRTEARLFFGSCKRHCMPVPPAFSSALPDFSFQIFPQEPTPPMAVPLERQAVSGASNSPARNSISGTGLRIDYGTPRLTPPRQRRGAAYGFLRSGFTRVNCNH